MVSTSRGDWRLGLMHAGITACAWGILPVALKQMLSWMDPYTITWFRFLVAAGLTALYLRSRGRMPALRGLDRRGWWLLAIAVSGLVGNYVLYLLGLSYISPGSAQLLIQMAPMFLLIGGLLVLRESFSWLQWIGLLVMFVGLGLFLNDRLMELLAFSGEFTAGVVLLFLASITWAAYGLCQKLLQNQLTGQGILLVIYVCASVMLLPLAQPGRLFELGAWPLAVLAFCSLNTVVAYGSFAEALKHWEATRISAVLALTPLLTMGFASVLAALPTGYVSEESLDWVSLAGAILVVSGSATCALAGRRIIPATT
ncbi:MAG: DMT family transporter [Gammaproteobacteria bacterium]